MIPSAVRQKPRGRCQTSRPQYLPTEIIGNNTPYLHATVQGIPSAANGATHWLGIGALHGPLGPSHWLESAFTVSASYTRNTIIKCVQINGFCRTTVSRSLFLARHCGSKILNIDKDK